MAPAHLDGWIGALRHCRAVNETISSLLMAYIAIASIEPSGRRPAARPGLAQQTFDASDDPAFASGHPRHGLHRGLLSASRLRGLVVLIEKTSFGFACRVTGGNLRAAQLQGLPVVADRHCLRARRRLRRACRYDRSRRRARQGQCLACRRLRLCRHSHRFPGAAEPAGYHPDVAAARRHHRRGRDRATPDGFARCDGACAAGHDLHLDLGSETLYGRIAWFQPRKSV